MTTIVLQETLSPPPARPGGKIEEDPGPWMVALCPRCSRMHHYDPKKGPLPSHCQREGCECPLDFEKGRKFVNDEAASAARGNAPAPVAVAELADEDEDD